LEQDVLVTSKDSPAALNRFIYYPDHLVRMPGPGVSFLENLSTLITEPIFHGVLLRAAMEILQPKVEGLDDESVSSFISRRFGSPVVDNIVSAVLHGIYAGNVDQLSAKSILPMLWKAEQTTGSLIRHMMTGDRYIPEKDVMLMKQLRKNMLNAHNIPPHNMAVVERIRKSSVFTFKTGIGQLANALEQALHQMPNVTIKMNHPVSRLERLHPERDEYNDSVCHTF
jgi:oxygen-dependent protoporphyrinogen oxidase